MCTKCKAHSKRDELPHTERLQLILGSKQSSRMVGWAMNASHKLKEVPAHRVVNRNGILTGKHHFETADRMQELLEEEGVKIINDEIVDFDECFWRSNNRIGDACKFFFNFSTKSPYEIWNQSHSCRSKS